MNNQFHKDVFFVQGYSLAFEFNYLYLNVHLFYDFISIK